MILNEEFTARMKTLLADEYEEFLESLNKEPVKAFRVNTDKISLEDFKKINIFGNENIPYVENGFYLTYDKAGNHPYHHAGIIYIQEPSAMAPAECIEIEPDWKILDVCAAPGGKSTQLKNKLGQNGLLVSNEIISSRCRILTGNIERLGFKNCVTFCKDTIKLAEMFPNTFDMVMVDAPCSGEGMFRKEAIALSEWSTENVLNCAKRQKEILNNAAETVKKGGYIVYSTCTYSLEENEMTVDDFLTEHADFELVKVKDKVEKCSSDGINFEGCKHNNLNLCRRFYPHKNRGEGQFVAVLHNVNTVTENYTKNYVKSKIPQAVYDFLDDVLISYNKDAVTLRGDTISLFDLNNQLDTSKAFCVGVTVGQFNKNFIKPHHQFFMAYGDKFKNKISLSAQSPEIIKYLHGEEFNTSTQSGWATVLVDGCTVGGVKVSNGVAKNHYPKGLRTLY
ncbi:MAG: methyltransferase domain-containing protein [Ruminococcaceae bacterium]|nr:methyltransferase domain-containing protein [Oscillospiraceae bacterium]